MRSSVLSLVLAAMMAAAVSAQPVTSSDQPSSPTVPTRSASEAAADEAMRLLTAVDVSLEVRIEGVTNILEGYPDQAEVWAALGELRMQAADDDEALRAFERAVFLDPTLHSAWHWIGILRKREKRDLEGALAAFRKAIEHGAPEAVELNEIGVTLAQLGRMSEALQTWERAIELDPDWGVLYANGLKAAASLGREEKARSLFERSLKAERFEERAVLMWGDHLVRAGRRKEALAAYRTALDAKPANPRIRYYYAATLLEEGDQKKAIEEYRTTLEFSRADGDKTTESVVRKALFALEHRKEMERMLQAEGLIFQVPAKSQDIEKNLRKAVELLDPIVQEHGEFWEPALLRGVALRRLGDHEKARRDFEKVLEAVPEQPNALINMALLFRETANYYNAVEYARRAVDAAPRDPAVLVNAGFVMVDTLRCDEARELAQRVRTIVPEEHLDEALAPLLEELKLKCPEQ